MSRHIFEQTQGGKRYRVIMGWDRPLQQFFGMILEETEFEDGESEFCSLEPHWSSLDLEGFDGSLEIVRVEIASRGFQIPDEMLKRLVGDRAENVGNRNTTYLDGKIQVRDLQQAG